MATWLFIGAQKEWVNLDQVDFITRKNDGSLALWIRGDVHAVPAEDTPHVDAYLRTRSLPEALGSPTTNTIDEQNDGAATPSGAKTRKSRR